MTARRRLKQNAWLALTAFAALGAWALSKYDSSVSLCEADRDVLAEALHGQWEQRIVAMHVDGRIVGRFPDRDQVFIRFDDPAEVQIRIGAKFHPLLVRDDGAQLAPVRADHAKMIGIARKHLDNLTNDRLQRTIEACDWAFFQKLRSPEVMTPVESVGVTVWVEMEMVAISSDLLLGSQLTRVVDKETGDEAFGEAAFWLRR